MRCRLSSSLTARTRLLLCAMRAGLDRADNGRPLANVDRRACPAVRGCFMSAAEPGRVDGWPWIPFRSTRGGEKPQQHCTACDHSLLFCRWICRPTPGPGRFSSLPARTRSGRGLFRAPLTAHLTARAGSARPGRPRCRRRATVTGCCLLMWLSASRNGCARRCAVPSPRRRCGCATSAATSCCPSWRPVAVPRRAAVW